MLAPLTTDRALALLTPSAQVLAASACHDGGLSRAAALPWAAVHWPTLLSLVAWERAEGPVDRLVRSAPPDLIPDDVRQTLHGLARVAAFRAGAFADSAAMAVAIFAAAGIEVVWLKGAALAMQSEAGFDLRRMGDLDVLVHPADLPAARAALAAGGWQAPAGSESARYTAHHHDAPMTSPSGVKLELHGAVFPHGHPFAAAEPAVWFARSRLHAWHGNAVRVLPMSWHLVHASVHWAWSHEGEVGTWQYLHDVHRAAGELDWNDVASHAAMLGASRPVGWALWAAAMVGGATVPPAIVARLRGSAGLSQTVAERVWVVRMFRSTAGSPSVRWARYWWRTAMGGLGDAAGAWPWRLGEVPGSVDPGVESSGPPWSGGAFARWRRHLRRLGGG